MKIGNITYIPAKVIPKVYRSVFKTKPAPKVATPNKPTHVISVNGNHFVPITNQTVKPIKIDGKTYIPVFKAPVDKVSSLKPITPTKSGPVDTFKIGNVHYIPLAIIPKVSSAVFKPVKKPTVVAPNPVIKINDSHYVPITNKTVKPIVIDGKTYIPVKKANDT